jgi:hypothetical protein
VQAHGDAANPATDERMWLANADDDWAREPGQGDKCMAEFVGERYDRLEGGENQEKQDQ